MEANILKEISPKTKNILGLVVRIAVSVVIIAIIIWKYDELKNIDVRAIVDASGNFVIAVISILGVYLIKSLTFVVPANIIYVAVGMAFDWRTAMIINSVGIALEVTSTYLFGMVMGGKKVVEKVEATKYGEKLLKMQSKNKLSALFAIRVSPFPIDIVSLLLGAMRTPFGQYIAVSLAGILPRVLLFTLLGDGLYDYIPMQKLIVVAAILIPIALAVWVIRYAVKNVRKKKEEE